MQEHQRLQNAEARQIVVEERDIPGTLLQRLTQALSRLDAPPLGLHAAAVQRAQKELDVVGGVLDEQDGGAHPAGLRHFTTPRPAAGLR